LAQVGAQYRVEAAGKMKSGDFANAERLLRRAGTLDPTDPLALAGLAECRWAIKDEALAKSWAQLALLLDEGQPEALVVLADISLAKNQTIQAKKLYEKALERSPAHKHARVQLQKLSQLPSPSAESTHTTP
jgi:Flp pilus assembly protein TadD